METPNTSTCPNSERKEVISQINPLVSFSKIPKLSGSKVLSKVKTLMELTDNEADIFEQVVTRGVENFDKLLANNTT